MRLRLAALSLALLTGCSGGGTAPASSPASAPVLSPAGFTPVLRLRLPAGWTSEHRGDDGFDLVRDGVTVALLTPDAPTAAAALGQLRERLEPVSAVTGRIAGRPADGFDVEGGVGLLVASPRETVSLDRVPGGRARVLATDVQDVPLVAVVLVPAGGRWDALLPEAERLLDVLATG